MGKEYSTKDIQELCGISRKQLRYYEEKGLLHTVLRNEDNNYRYYTETNLRELLSIREFMRIGFTTEAIQKLFSDSSLNNIAEIIKKRIENVKEELTQSFLRYEQLTYRLIQLDEAINLRNIDDIKNPNMQYEVVDFPETSVLLLKSQQLFGVSNQIEKMAKLMDIMDEDNITASGSIISIFYNHFGSQECSFNNQFSEAELCVPVSEKNKKNPYYKVISGCKAASAIFFGDFYQESLKDTYINLMQWAKQNDYKLSNNSIEEWLINPLDTSNPNLWVVKIMIPFIE